LDIASSHVVCFAKVGKFHGFSTLELNNGGIHGWGTISTLELNNGGIHGWGTTFGTKDLRTQGSRRLS